MTWKELIQHVSDFLMPFKSVQGEFHALRATIDQIYWDAQHALDEAHSLRKMLDQHLAEHETENEQRAKIAASVEKTLAGLEHDHAA